MAGTVWPFGPNIRRSPYVVVREFKTDIIVTRAGREQRRSLRQYPRKRIEYSTAQTEGCLRDFDRSMVSAQRTLLAIPERVRFVILDAGIGGGGTSVIIDLAPTWIQEGAVLMLVAPGRYGLRTVDSIAGNIVTFVEFDAEAWPAGTRLHPSLDGYLDANILAPIVATRGIIEASVVFHVDPGSETEEDEGTITEVHGGREVFLIRPDRWQTTNLGRVQEGVGNVDYGFGRVKHFFPIEFATRMWDADYTSCDTEHAEIFRQFFARMRGRRNEFYMPTWQEDLVPVSGLTAGGSTITVEDAEVDTIYSNDTVFKAIAVKLNDGSWLFRSVSSIATVSGDLSILTVSAVWGQDVSLSEIAMICWLPVWRFATDVLTMTWPHEDVAQIRLSFQMLEDLVIEEEDVASDDPPVLLSPTSYSVEEGQPLDFLFNVSMPVDGIIFDGGADDEFFIARSGRQIEWIDGFLPDFSNPLDAGANNTYITRIIFVGANGVNSIPYTITWTIEDVSTVVVGAATLTIDTVSYTQIKLNVTAANALLFEYEKDASGVWLALPVNGIVNQQSGTTADYRARGRAGGDIGSPSAIVQGTTEAMPTLYNPNAVVFSGTAWLTLIGSLTGLVDGKQGTLVLTIDPTGGDGTARRLYTNTGHYFSARLQTNNKLQIIGKNAVGDIVLQMVTTNAFLANTGYKQLLISFDLAAGLGYIKSNGVTQELELSQTILVNDDIDFTRANSSFGAAVDGTAPFTGRISDSAFHDVFIPDTSVNIAKFIGSDGRVRDPGADGTAWFGEPALALLHDITATWHTNDGTGGGYTLNGTLTQATVGPNGTLASAPFTMAARQSDDFIEFQGVQYNRNWSTPAWQSNGSEPYLGPLGIRRVRGGWGLASTRAIANRIFTSYGIRVSMTFNPLNETTGVFNFAEIDRVLADLKATSGITTPMGLAKLFAIEGANEYTLKNLYEYRYTVNTTNNTLTLVAQGAKSRNQTSLNSYSDANPEWCVNGAIVQIRAGTVNGRESANTGTVPGGLIKDTPYYIRDKTVAGNVATFKLALTASGPAIDISSVGSVPSGAYHMVSPWAPRLRAFQAYIWNKVVNDPTYAAWHNAGGIVLSPTIWGRCRIDYQAFGNTDSTTDRSGLHLYNAVRLPDHYNGVTGDDYFDEAFREAQRGGTHLVDTTEWAQDFANSFGGNVTIASCTELVATKYISRGVCEFWLMHLQGLVGNHNYFSFLDSLSAGEYQGLLSYNGGSTFTPRLPYWTWRNLNFRAKDALWSGTSWSYPTFTPGALNYNISPTPSQKPDIKYFVLEKANGTFLFYIWHNWKSWVRGNPGAETTRFTAAASDILTVHNQLYADFVTGDGCTISSDGTLPGNVSANTLYYIIKTGTTNQIKIADTLADALANIPRNISSAGSGVHTLTPRIRVQLTVSAPIFSSVASYEPTVLPGEDEDDKRDNAVLSSGSPNATIDIYVPDHPVVVQFNP